MIELKFECLDVQAPSIGHPGDACWDLYRPADIVVWPHSFGIFSLNISFDIPEGYCIKIYPRSSTLYKYNLLIPTSIIDANYKKFVHLQCVNTGTEKVTVEAGKRLVQFKLEKLEQYTLKSTSIVSDDSRGGLGSTGV